MALTRWTNPSLPQTLQIAVFLFYMDAVFTVLFGGLNVPILALLAAGGVAAGLGIANEKRWGYQLAVVVTSIGVALLLWAVVLSGPDLLIDIEFLFYALIPVAMFIAVVHPLSRQHQRIWFR